MTTRQINKQAIRLFLRTPVWTTEKLCGLLAHAESKLRFYSCCCLAGAATADHALQGFTENWYAKHYVKAEDLPLAKEAESAYYQLAFRTDGMHRFGLISEENDAQRRRILRPIIRAELRRRERIAELESNQEPAICYSGSNLQSLVSGNK